MYTSFNLLLAAFVVLTRVAIATPPACLLAALGLQPDPADLASLCGSGALQGNITSKCTGTDESDAMSIYSSSCSAVGITIAVSSTSSSVSTTSVSTDESSATTGAAPVTTSGASATSTAVTITDTSASSTGERISGTAIGPGGYTTGNSTALSGVAGGSTPMATTATQSDQTSPISFAASKFSSFKVRLIAALSLNLLRTALLDGFGADI